MKLSRIIGMEQFQEACRKHFVEWYVKNQSKDISYNDTYVVWSVKALQNFKCLVSCNQFGDGIYAEYTYNGDKRELYCDHYKKLTNECVKEEQ